jgi:anti-sigma factor RsiW
MNDRRRPDRNDAQDSDLHTDILISKLVDGEATDEERQRFDHLAAAEPTLWRLLALRQQDMSVLAEEVRNATATIERTDLPQSRAWIVPARLSWPLVFSGWAAVIVLAVSWAVVSLAGARAPRAGIEASAPAAPRMTAEEHLEAYLRAPYVLGDMQPVVMEVEELSDGRVAVHFVRRIEEVAFLDPSVDLPVDEDGELTRDPRTLRQSEPEVGFPIEEFRTRN